MYSVVLGCFHTSPVWFSSNKLLCISPFVYVLLGWCESCNWNLVRTKQPDRDLWKRGVWVCLHADCGEV